jgi:4-hydroxybenzoate polyprenyltransferase
MVLLLGWTAIKGEIDIIPIIFYLGAIFWTLGYDTIYGFQDIKDDEIIGLKSTSIKFKGNEKKFLFTCYSLLINSFLAWRIFMKFNNILLFFNYCTFYAFIFLSNKKLLNQKSLINCLKVFKSNNIFGLIIFLNILIS